MGRTWPQRLLIAFNLVCIVAALSAAGLIAYAKHEVSQIPRVTLRSDGFKSSKTIADDAPRNFLVVGADSDDGLATDDPVRAARAKYANGIRSDTIMVVRVDPASRDAKVLSFPRDLYVDIPGHGKGRINEALEEGGGKPDLLISTIKAEFGIEINHYVQVDFAGFKAMVRLLDGIPIYFDTPVRDGSNKGSSGLNVKTAGCTTLDETGALQYVRSRYFQHRNEDGDWVYDRGSDLARISRQQDFIRRVIGRARSQGLRNPYKLKSFVQVGADNIILDQDTSAGDLIALGQRFRNFKPSEFGGQQLPVVGFIGPGGAQVLDLVTEEAEPILAQFRGTGPRTSAGIDPSTVTVRVLNGTGALNQGAKTTVQLGAAGFRTEAPGDQNVAPAQTEVRYRPGQEDQAVLVARYLFATPVLVRDAEATAITVVTGPDFGQALPRPRPESDVQRPASTTTSSSTTTTTAGSTGSSTPGATPTTSAGGTKAPTTSTSTTTTTSYGYVPPKTPKGVKCG